MKSARTLLAPLLLAPLAALYAADAPKITKPNILVLLSDDQGYYDLSCQGCQDIQTPHIDSLAKNGIRCTSGYVSAAMCSPSRAGLITGRSQSRFGHEINWPDDDHTGVCGLPLTEKTLADHLKAAGYRTACIGKWHLGDVPMFHPNRRGFDEFFGFINGGHDYFCEKYGPAKDAFQTYQTLLERNGKPEPLTTPALRPVASATWRELIKRVWEVDPLICPRCGTEMAKIAVLKDPVVITKILRHLGLWEEPPARGPPPGGTVYEPCYDPPQEDAESNDQASAADEQAFPDYDQPDPEPVYD